MSTLYLVRHGENPANVYHILSFHKADFRLTARGEQQAAEARRQLGDLSGCSLWSSPLRRAVHTAELLAPTDVQLRVLEGLRELDVGDLDGSATPQDRQAYYRVITAWRSGDPIVRFPGGENLIAAVERLRQALTRAVVVDPDGTAVVVSHGGLLTEGLLSLLDHADRRRFQSAHQPRWLNCEIARLNAHSTPEGDLRLSWCRWYSQRDRSAASSPEEATCLLP